MRDDAAGPTSRQPRGSDRDRDTDGSRRVRVRDTTPLHRSASPIVQGLAFDPDSGLVHEDTAAAVRAARTGGGALSPELRATFEQRLGADLSGVRVHTDASADRLSRSLAAEAFTVQQDVFFRSGRFTPHTTAGSRLLAHELTHVAQNHGSSGVGPLRVSSPNEMAEREAEHVAADGGPGADPGPLQHTDQAALHRSPEKESLKVATDRMVAQYVEGFDVALGKWLADHPQAMAGGEFLLLGVHKILKKQFAEVVADAVKKTVNPMSEADFLIRAFGPTAELGKMPGAPVVKKIDDLVAIAKSTSGGSLRTKATLVYQSIRCGLLTAAMQAARTESETGPGSQKARDQRVKTGWGLEGKQLRQADVATNDPNRPDPRKYFSRQDRVDQQQRDIRGGEGTGLAAQEARTVGESEFVGITLSLDELKIVAKGDQKARAAAQKVGKDYDTLSESEQRTLMIQEYKDVKLPEYTPGFAVYRIDPTAPEAKQASAKHTEMVGGLSGSTDMYLHLASYLGASKDQLQLVRLAALGEMLPRRDHSFYEVVVAARGYGLKDIDPTKGVAAYAKIPPLKKADVQQGTGMTLPSDYRKGATTSAAQQTLREDLRDVQASVAEFARRFKAAPDPAPADMVKQWQDYFQATVYRWSHDAKISAALVTINAKLGSTTGVSVVLPGKPERDAALGVLRIVQQHSGNPTRVVPEAHASKAFTILEALVGTIPANQVLAAYVSQYVGKIGLIIPSIQFAMDIAAVESGAKPLPPITEIGDKSNGYLTQIWSEAQSKMHSQAQQAEKKFADSVAALDPSSPTYAKDKKALQDQWKRTTATGAVETWKRVQAQIQAIEGLDPIERYAIYTYTQGQFYNELNSALANEQKLTTKERAVAIAATTGLRKLPVYPGPVYRAQRSGAQLRRGPVTAQALGQAKAWWKQGMVETGGADRSARFPEHLRRCRPAAGLHGQAGGCPVRHGRQDRKGDHRTLDPAAVRRRGDRRRAESGARGRGDLPARVAVQGQQAAEHQQGAGQPEEGRQGLRRDDLGRGHTGAGRAAREAPADRGRRQGARRPPAAAGRGSHRRPGGTEVRPATADERAGKEEGRRAGAGRDQGQGGGHRCDAEGLGSDQGHR